LLYIFKQRLLAELKRVLLRDKFRKYLSVEETLEYVNLLHRLAVTAQDPPEIHGLTPDPDDDYLVSLP
jgi:predicted nucleic acid-binding protein